MAKSQVWSRKKRPAAVIGRASWKTTKYLCAGVYLDREFLDLVIRKVCNDARHWVAPSYGFDLVPVARHAWQARALEAIQQALLVLVLSLGWVWETPAGLTACCVAGLGWVLPKVLRAAPSVLLDKAKSHADKMLKRSGYRGDSLSERSRLFALGAAVCVFLLLVPLAVAASDKDPLPGVLRSATVLLLLMAAIAAACGAARQVMLNRLHNAMSVRPPRLTQREAVIDSQQDYAYVIYQRQNPKVTGTDTELSLFPGLSRAPTFFVGSGKLLHRWPLVLRLVWDGPESWAERVCEHAPFAGHELVEHLREAVSHLRDDPDPKMRLPGVRVTDRIFIAEPDVAEDRGFLIPPAPATVNAIIDYTHDKARHFLQISVAPPDGELVTTVFLRVCVNGGSLALEVAASALTRTPQDYHRLDGYAASGMSAVALAALAGVRDAPSEILRSWRFLEVPWLLLGAARACTDHTLVPRRWGTIGPRASIREAKSTPWSEADHDRTQIMSHVQIIETCLLHATEDFLASHGIDVSGFSSKADTIINANVVNTGGETHIDSSAIGPGARNTNNNSRDNTGGPGSGGGKS